MVKVDEHTNQHTAVRSKNLNEISKFSNQFKCCLINFYSPILDLSVGSVYWRMRHGLIDIDSIIC